MEYRQTGALMDVQAKRNLGATNSSHNSPSPGQYTVRNHDQLLPSEKQTKDLNWPLCHDGDQINTLKLQVRPGDFSPQSGSWPCLELLNS